MSDVIIVESDNNDYRYDKHNNNNNNQNRVEVPHTTVNTATSMNDETFSCYFEVDVIIPVYNASETIIETIQSAMNQIYPIYTDSDYVIDDDNDDVFLDDVTYENENDDNNVVIAADNDDDDDDVVVDSAKDTQNVNKINSKNLNNNSNSNTSNNQNTTTNTKRRKRQREKTISNSVFCNNKKIYIEIHVCCYDDGSTDNSWIILQEQVDKYNRISTEAVTTTTTTTRNTDENVSNTILSYLHIEHGTVSRGAGYARNRAVDIRSNNNSSATNNNTTNNNNRLLCWLDSDDTMYPTRIYEQVQYLYNVRYQQNDISTNGTSSTIDGSKNIILGCTFDRIPKNSTWHYTQWANTVSTDRLLKEQFREITIIQPTWMMYRARFIQLGGYIEAPSPSPPSIKEEETTINDNNNDNNSNTKKVLSFSIQDFIQKEKLRMKQLQNGTNTKTMSSTNVNSTDSDNSTNNDNDYNYDNVFCLVHETETIQTIRIAEDLRFFYTHLYYNGQLHVVRLKNNQPLVSYRHRTITTTTATTTLNTTASKEENTTDAVKQETESRQNQLTTTTTATISQSGQTSRKLLFQLRTMAFEEMILRRSWCCTGINNNNNDSKNTNTNNTNNNYFVVWGAGRDGRDFIKALHTQYRQYIYCIVDVDDKKINTIGFYENRTIQVKIPIVHFSLLRRRHQTPLNQDQSIDTLTVNNNNQLINVDSSSSQTSEVFGKINKSFVQDIRQNVTTTTSSATSNDKTDSTETVDKYENNNDTTVLQKRQSSIGCQQLDLSILPTLPVVVCVAMYRTNGALEQNVQSIGRTEGTDLWHFC